MKKFFKVRIFRIFCSLDTERRVTTGTTGTFEVIFHFYIIGQCEKLLENIIGFGKRVGAQAMTADTATESSVAADRGAGGAAAGACG